MQASNPPLVLDTFGTWWESSASLRRCAAGSERLVLVRFGVLRRFLVRCVACAGLLCFLVVPAAGAVDGTGWIVTRSPNPLTGTGTAFSVACPGASDCIAVGSHLTRSGRGVALAERWDGERWRIL